MNSHFGLADDPMPPEEAAVAAACVAFLKEASAARHPSGPIRRFNQGRATACVEGELVVPGDLRPESRVGLFAEPARYRALIRFANASSASDEERDVRGMSIALENVPGTNLTPGSTRQDFVLNSHPVMMAPDTRAFLELLRANEAGGLKRALYFSTHPKAARIAFASRQRPSCHLDIPYWSTTPYLFGEDRAVKYVVRPKSARTSPPPARYSEHYLRDAIAAHLSTADATFDFCVQFYENDRTTPVEDATVEWRTPEHRVAAIRIPPQSLDDPVRAHSCESASFNPWHGLIEHRPLGNMNRARRVIYEAMSEFRRAAAAST